MKWDISKMLESSSFDEQYVNVEKKIELLKNKIDFSLKKDLLKLLDLYFSTQIELDHIYVYAHLLLDENHKDDYANGLFNKVRNLVTYFSAESSYIDVELLKLSEDFLKELSQDLEFKNYHAYLKDVIRSKKYTLNSKEERIISLSSTIRSTAYNVYSTLTNADLKFSNVLDSNSNSHEFSENDWGKIARSNDRIFRKNAYFELMNTYGNFNNTFTTLYLNEIASDIFTSTARNYENTRQKRLFENHIDEKCYDDLVKGVNNNLKTNYKYMDLRKKIMNVDELHLYDMYVNMVSESDESYAFETGKEMINKALSVLGETYVNDMNKAYTESWIDVYPGENKRGGAYSSGSYKSAPYILLNYDNTLNDVFTLAHELGHSMHSYYSKLNNNYYESQYKIFVAEIASTTNELLLTFDLLSNDIDSKQRAYLLNNLLEQFRTTVFRQTMFAEFEYKSHVIVEKNEEVNANILNELYFDLNKKYFGDCVVIDECVKYEWSRIPHFYYDYYVYQYATSFLAAVSISKKIFAQNSECIKNYLQFLKTGDSLKPLDAVKLLGIDMLDTKYIDEALSYYNEVLEEFEEVMKEH